MTDDRRRDGRYEDDLLEAIIGEAREAYNPPPPTPTGEIWARIEAERASGEEARGWAGGPEEAPGPRNGVLPFRRSRDGSGSRVRPALAWGVGIAAVLALGIALGRFSAMAPTPPTAGAPAEEEGAPGAGLYRVAAAEHFARADALLTALGSDDAPAGDGRLARWAGDLLSETRLYLDSPAGDDSRLRSLLEDLELVLAQIAVLDGEDGGERARAVEAVEGRDLLLRVRSASSRPSQGI